MRHSICALFVVAVLVADVRAQEVVAPSDAELRLAEDDLARGRFDEACAVFARAETPSKSARVGAGLGRCALEEGDFVNAYVFLAQALAADAEPLVGRARGGASSALRRATARVGRVYVDVDPRPASAEVVFSGRVPTVVDGAYIVEPGRYFVAVIAPGFDIAQRPVDVRAGSRARARIQLVRARPASGGIVGMVAPRSSARVGEVGLVAGGPPPIITTRRILLRLRMRPPTIDGPLDSREAFEVLASSHNDLQRCTDTPTVVDDTFQNGSIALDFMIAPDGRTSAVRVASSTLSSAEVGACFVRVLEGARFSEDPSRASTRVSVTFEYVRY